MGRRLTIAGVVTAALAFAPVALAASETASAGGVTATFTFTGHGPNYHNERLTIARAGTVAYDQPVASGLCLQACAPGSEGSGRTSVHVLNLEPGGEPDVVLDLFSGGAHCCSIEQVFSFDPGTMTYVKTERNFGDPGTEIMDLGHNGRLEFLTADDSFAYEFTDFAASGLPIQILTFANRHFTDVTRSYPALIAKDAATWLSAFKSMASQHYQDSVGVIAAWAADEDLLGHTAQVDRYLAKQVKAGHLHSALNPGESGKRFVAKLRRFLRGRGYLS
jgi:hypothetical protein